MMFIQNTEGQEVILWQIPKARGSTELQTFMRIQTEGLNTNTDANLREPMYSLAFGIWYNMFLLHRDTALFNLLTRISFSKHISHQTQIVHSHFHLR